MSSAVGPGLTPDSAINPGDLAGDPEENPMPEQIPCIWMDGTAEEAAAHYTSVFPNSSIGDVTRYGPDQPMPEGTAMTVKFTLDGQEYVALNGGPQFPHSEAISFQIMCADQEEATTTGTGSPRATTPPSGTVRASGRAPKSGS